MARDDWRVRIELAEEGAAARLLQRLGLDLGSHSRDLARELERHRLVVSRDADSVFVYASTAEQAERAREVVDAELREEGIEARAVVAERWLADEDRWDADPEAPTVEEELIARGIAPWEVRAPCRSRQEAQELERRLEQEGYDVVRHWRYVVVGASSREEADELARRLHGAVEPSSELVWEVVPQNPFAVFGGLGGSGTPL